MKTMTRRQMLKNTSGALGGVAMGAMLTSGPSEAQTPGVAQTPGQAPNIIFVLADDLGYGDLGCYGQEQIQTPHLDRMAAEGMRFTDVYSGSTVCAPSRCCLMTGLHTGHAFVRGNGGDPLRAEDVTIAEVLKDAGYATALVGKWGLGEPDTSGLPNRQGFDYFYGYLNQGRAHNYYPAYLWRNEEKVLLEGNVEHEDEDRVSVKCTQYSHDLFTKEAMSFLDRAATGKPFFLCLAYTMPHANNERGRMEKDGMEVPSYAPYEDTAWPNPQKGHAAMITRMDRDVGTLFAKLKELGIDENTIVFFSSDNGPHKEGGADPAFFQSGGGLRGYKRDLYEGGVRVPAMVRWPGKVPAGVVSGQPWAFWDFLPTAAELAGAQVPAKLDGVSMAPVLLEQKPVEHPPLYWEFHERGYTRAVRMGKWKAVSLGPDKPLELYDLTQDIGEKNDVAAAHPEVVAQFEEYLATARTPSALWPGKKAKAKKK